MSTTAIAVRPKKNVLFGVTHTLEGQAVVRVPRAVKIGIGVPAGKDVEVYIDFDGSWVVRSGEKRGRYENRATAERDWSKAVASAPECKYPKKLDYFTFTRPGSIDYDPDFDAIEHHGPKPREIDVVFIENDPLQQSFQIWSKSELRCEGDGVNAMRSFAFAQTTLPDGKKRVEEAKDDGLDRVPIINGCYACGCPIGTKKECKPTTLLNFQLMSAPRLGSTAYFHSTSFRTAANLFSNLHQFRVMSGSGDPERGFVAGIPLKMVLRPHKVTPKEGTVGTAYNVALEFRAESANLLRQKLVQSGLEYARLQEAPKQIAAPAAPKPEPVETVPVEEPKGTAATHDDDGEDFQDVSAAAVQAEFYADAGDEDTHTERGTEPDTEPPSGSAEAADELGELKVSMMRAGRSEAVIQQVTAHYSKLIGEGMLPDKAIRQVIAADLANVEPAGPAEKLNREEIVTQSQWVDMVTYAKDELKMSEADLKNVVKKHGHASGDLTTMPKSVFRSVMDDLQKPRTARTQEVSAEKKSQRKFSL
jgi:hypothetical protein